MEDEEYHHENCDRTDCIIRHCGTVGMVSDNICSKDSEIKNSD
jgi:hypothetical protein